MKTCRPVPLAKSERIAAHSEIIHLPDKPDKWSRPGQMFGNPTRELLSPGRSIKDLSGAVLARLLKVGPMFS